MIIGAPCYHRPVESHDAKYRYKTLQDCVLLCSIFHHSKKVLPKFCFFLRQETSKLEQIVEFTQIGVAPGYLIEDVFVSMSGSATCHLYYGLAGSYFMYAGLFMPMISINFRKNPFCTAYVFSIEVIVSITRF